jgi:hypothetical protein
LKKWFVAALRVISFYAAGWGILVCLALFALKLLGLGGDTEFWMMVVFGFILCFVVMWVNLRAMKFSKQPRS